MSIAKTRTLDELVNWQREQAFTGFYEDLDIKEYAKNFKGNPNEAYHIFDTQNLTIEMTENNFDKVFSMPGFQPTSIFQILELIHKEQQAMVFTVMDAILANETAFEPGKDSVCQIYMIANEQMIMKTSTPLIQDDNRHVIYVLEQYRNVTDLVSRGQYTWSFKGPNTERITKLIQSDLDAACPLSSQELKILSFIGLGLSSKQAADRLFLSKHTVDTHRRNILRKLGAENTPEALKMAQKMGILA